MNCLALLALAAQGITFPVIEPGNGANLSFQGRTTAVRLLREEIDITPRPDCTSFCSTFIFVNPTDAEIPLVVGFPDEDDRIRKLCAWVDGKAQDVKRTKEHHKHDDPPMTWSTDWQSWSMSFPPGRECKVELTYDVGLYKEPLEETWARIAPVEAGFQFHANAEWRGTISKASLRLHYGPLRRKLRTALTRETEWHFDEAKNVDVLELSDLAVVEGSLIHWVFEQLTPMEQGDLLTAALHKGKLHFGMMKRLLQLIESSRLFIEGVQQPNLLGIKDDEEVLRRAVEVFERMVPPKGPKLKYGDVEGPTEDYDDAFNRLFLYYRYHKLPAKAAAVAEAQRQWIQQIIDAHNDPDNASARDVRREREAELERLRRDVRELYR